MLDAVTLSRMQFAGTIMFHYLFPPLTIGIGVVLVYLEARFLWTHDFVYERAARFWTELFAATFAMGVATGLVMEFQFGTNWAAYSRFVGDVFGSALAAEGIFAFFLESGFLAVLVFGWDRVSPGFHFVATLMVALGSMFSAVWIVVANSWQQTPAGHQMVPVLRDGQPWLDAAGHPIMRAVVVDFWDVVFSPSSVNRLTHTLIGAVIVGTFFVMSVSAWYLLRGRHEDFARRSFSGALILALVFSLAQLVSGDANARMVANHQPAKLAAFEGHFRTEPAGLSLIGWPDDASETVRFDVAIPGLLSFLVSGDPDRPVTGLDRVPRAYWPPVLISFLTYHAMVGIGMALIGLTLIASLLYWRGVFFAQRWLLWTFVFAVLLAVAANELGWVAAEVGRQPWVVHPGIDRDTSGDFKLDQQGFLAYRLREGLLTRDAVSPSVHAGEVLASIAMFGCIYALLFAIWLAVLWRKIQAGPVIPQLRGSTDVAALTDVASSRIDHRASLNAATSE